MTVLTRKKEAVLDRLIQLAGSAALVEKALRDLSAERGTPPTLEDIVRRILENRAASHRSVADAPSVHGEGVLAE